MTGRVIGNYRIIDKLGEGGMGKVYRAIDVMVEREVAMKAVKSELASKPEALERFRAEATLLAKLNHPAIAQLYTFFRDGDDFYMVMEYAPGQTLERLIQEQGAIPWAKALDIAARVLAGIGHAHRLNILHRDLKPANIIVSPTGEVKVTDFGIAQALGASRTTREGRIIGTLEYIAPERVAGKPADARSDLYSMGIVLFEMLTGTLPFQSDSEFDLMLAQVQHPVPKPRDRIQGLPPEVEEIVLKALEKDPERRYQDAFTFASELRQAQSKHNAAPVAATRSAVAPAPVASAAAPAAQSKSFLSKSMLLAAGAGLAALAMLITAAVLWRQPKPKPDPAVEIASEVPVPKQEPAAASPAPIVPPAPVPIEQILGVSPPSDSTAPPPEGTTPPAPVRTAPPPKPAVPTPPVLTPEARRAVLASLDQTDGPATGEPGSRPIHKAGLLLALRSGAPAFLSEIADAVGRRGVNFLLNPQVEQELRSAGATVELVKTVQQSYRAPEPPPAPSAPVEPPPTVRRRSIQTLSDVRTLYVEKMPGDVDEFLRARITTELGARLKIVKSPGEADARMRMKIDEKEGGAVSKAGRFFGLKDRTRVTVRITDSATDALLWEEEAGDRKPILGAFQSDTANRIATRVAKRLKDDLE